LDLLIKNISELYSGEKEKTFKNIFMIIENNEIKKIESMQNCPEEKEFDKVINADDKIALPGFINTHTHSAMTLMRGYADDMPLQKWLENKIWPFEAQLSSDDIYWGTALGILEMLKSGTTVFSDMYFSMNRAAEIVEKSGIRAVLAEGLIEANDGKEGLENAVDFALDYNNTADGRITTMLAPHAPYTCSKDYLIEIRDRALESELPVHIHLSETREEVDAFLEKEGKSPIEFLNDFDFFKNHILAAHCVHLEKNDMEIIKEKNIHVAHNPTSNAKLGSGIAPLVEYLNNNVNISIGTDGVSSNNNLDMISEARMAAYLQKVNKLDPAVIDKMDLLQFITKNGAEALALKRLGVLKKGNKADLILVDTQRESFSFPHHSNLSNLFYAADSRVIDTVIIDGKVVVESAEVLTLDTERIYYEVEKRAAEIADNLKEN
jgi:5-methylthioadenosine/S-adenosylhomocysteine deaminase